MGGIISSVACPVNRPSRETDDGTTMTMNMDIGIDIEAAYKPTHSTPNTDFSEGYQPSLYNGRGRPTSESEVDINIKLTDPRHVRPCHCAKQEHSKDNASHQHDQDDIDSDDDEKSSLSGHVGTDVSAPFKPILKVIPVRFAALLQF